MIARDKFARPSIVMGICAVILMVAACTIRLRGDEEQTSSVAPISRTVNPLDAEIWRCRTVRPEQQDALDQCRRVWAEQRRHFLRQTKPRTAPPKDSAPENGLPTSAARKDESRLPRGWPSVPKLETE